MELSSADQIEQEFADELQNMSIKEEAAPVKKPSLARGFSEIDPNNEAAARGTSAQKQGSLSARQLPDEPSYRVALQQRYGELALQKKPQDSGTVRQLVASSGAKYRAPACDPWARGQLFR